MESNLSVILALLVTSLIVRVLPSFIPLRVSAKIQHLIEEILPCSIFICFITYLVLSEATRAPGPSILAFATAFILSIGLNAGLLTTTLLASIVYYLSG